MKTARYIKHMPVQRAEADDFFLANTDEWFEKHHNNVLSCASTKQLLLLADNKAVMAQNFDKPLIMDGVLI